MAVLEIRDAHGNVQTRKLSKTQPLSIGSHPANDIRVSDVPGLHSRISWSDDGYQVTAASAQEIDVSGRSTRHAPLRVGDILHVGNVEIFLRGTATQPASSITRPPRERRREPALWEAIDFECDPQIVEHWEQLVELQSPGLIAKLTKIRTPLPAVQYSYHCHELFHGDVRLADVRQDGGWKTMIEVRNEGTDSGGPGSTPRFNDTNCEYEHVGGPWVDQMETLTPDERNLLLRTTRWFDERKPAERLTGVERLADVFNRKAGWDEVLEGWTRCGEEAGVVHWRRPGKAAGVSAITNFGNRDLLYVFSSHAAIGNQCSYTRFAAYAQLHHGGNCGAAARELERQGYSDEYTQHLRRNLVSEFGGQVDVASVLKIGAENGTYYLQLRDGRMVKLGGIEDVLSHERCRAAIADQTRVLIPANEEGWPQTANAILQSAQVRHMGTLRDDVAGWLEMFVASCEPFASHSNYAAGTDEWKLQKLATFGKVKGKNGALFGEEGRLLLHFESFAWFVSEIDPQCSRRDLKNELVLLGFTSGVELSVDDGETRRSVRVWQSEPNIEIGRGDRFEAEA